MKETHSHHMGQMDTRIHHIYPSPHAGFLVWCTLNEKTPFLTHFGAAFFVCFFVRISHCLPKSGHSGVFAYVLINLAL